MKTTSLKLSKELKELGFKIKNEDDQIWKYNGQERWPFPAYDLETILDVLPDFVEILDIGMVVTNRSFLYLDKNKISYGLKYFQETKEGESLADTAARLLIKLIKDKIVEL